MEFWKYFNGKTDKIYCQARYEVREKERTRRVPRLCLEQQEEREAINQDGENWPSIKLLVEKGRTLQIL